MLQIDCFHKDIWNVIDKEQSCRRIHQSSIDCSCPADDALFIESESGKALRHSLENQTTKKDSHIPAGSFSDIGFDNFGRLLVCDNDRQTVVRYHNNSSFFYNAKYVVDNKEHQLVSPISLAFHSNNLVYFSDAKGIFYILPDNPGIIPALFDDLIKPVCIAISRSENFMYVSDRTTNSVLAFRFSHEGKMVHRTTFAFPSDYRGHPPVDIAIDAAGNVYCLTHSGIFIYDDAGLHLGLIHIAFSGKKLCFCGQQKKELLISGADGLYSIKVN